MIARGSAAAGWMLAIVSSAAFGVAGSFATPLIRSGWSSGAVVAARVSIAALVLLGPAIFSLRGRWSVLRRNIVLIAAYGLVAVAACQLFYFNALGTLDVGVALLLEYLGIVMIVLWLWVRHGQRPRIRTIVGTALSLLGLVFVLNLVGGGVQVDAVGVMWGLLAAVGLATHFVLSARPAHGLPPLALAAGGLGLGAVVLWLLGLVGMLPMHAEFVSVPLGGAQVPWWVPLLGVAVVSAAFAYVAAIASVRILGSKLASFVGLSEVIFAILFAWLLLGQLPGWIQLLGGVLIVGGVVFVRADEARAHPGRRREVVIAQGR